MFVNESPHMNVPRFGDDLDGCAGILCACDSPLWRRAVTAGVREQEEKPIEKKAAVGVLFSQTPFALFPT